MRRISLFSICLVFSWRLIVPFVFFVLICEGIA